MNAPLRHPIQTGSREELFGFTAETIANCIVELQHALDYADSTNLTGLGFALRTATAHFTAALTTYRDLAQKEVTHG